MWIFTLTSIMLLRVLWFCHWDGPHALWEAIQGGMSCQIPCSSSHSSSDFCFFARQTLLHAFAKCLLSYELHLRPSSQSEIKERFFVVSWRWSLFATHNAVTLWVANNIVEINCHYGNSRWALLLAIYQDLCLQMPRSSSDINMS